MDQSRVVEILHEMIDLLSKHGYPQIADRLRDMEHVFVDRYTSGTASGHAAALKELSLLYGGMGSLQDLTIISRPEHPLTPSEDAAANARLTDLLAELSAWRRAGEREHRSQG